MNRTRYNQGSFNAWTAFLSACFKALNVYLCYFHSQSKIDAGLAGDEVLFPPFRLFCTSLSWTCFLKRSLKSLLLFRVKYGLDTTDILLWYFFFLCMTVKIIKVFLTVKGAFNKDKFILLGKFETFTCN